MPAVPGGVDGRNPDWESPAAMRALLCHFAVRSGDGQWQALERTAPRCGRERPLGRTTVALGTPAPVPAPPDRDSMVLVRIDGIDVVGLEKLRALAFRALTREPELLPRLSAADALHQEAKDLLRRRTSA